MNNNTDDGLSWPVALLIIYIASSGGGAAAFGWESVCCVAAGVVPVALLLWLFWPGETK